MCCEWLPVVRDIVAIGGVAITAWKVTHEVKAWRTQKRATTRAEVAAEALIATIRFVEQLRVTCTLMPGLSNPAALDREKMKGLGADLRPMVRAEWQDFNETVGRAFIEAWRKSQVYLDEDAHDALAKLWSKKMTMWAAQTSVAVSWSLGDPDANFFAQGFGQSLGDELAQLEREVRAVLKPIAQLRSKD